MSDLKEAGPREAKFGDNSGDQPEAGADAVAQPIRISFSPPEDIVLYLDATYKASVKDRFAELEKSYREMPAAITTEEESGKAGDLVKEIRSWLARADGARKVENEPIAKAKATVDAFFKNMIETMDGTTKTDGYKQDITNRNEVFLKKKRDEAARLLAAAEEAKRVEAARLATLAAEAAERTRAAEEAASDAADAEREAKENRDELEQGRLDADAALKKAKLKKANARRDRNEEAFNAASAEVEQCTAALATAKTELSKARAAQREAAAEALRKEAATRAAVKETNTLTDSSARSTEEANKIKKKIDTSTDGDLSRGRSEHGAVNTLAKRWVCSIEDIKLVHENAQLYIGLIDPDVIRVAIGKRMAAGNRDVPGVLYEHKSSGLTL